jgi:hypothetical protein
VVSTTRSTILRVYAAKHVYGEPAETWPFRTRKDSSSAAEFARTGRETRKGLKLREHTVSPSSFYESGAIAGAGKPLLHIQLQR